MKELDQWAKSLKADDYSIKKGGNGLIFNAINSLLNFIQNIIVFIN